MRRFVCLFFSNQVSLPLLMSIAGEKQQNKDDKTTKKKKKRHTPSPLYIGFSVSSSFLCVCEDEKEGRRRRRRGIHYYIEKKHFLLF